MKLGNPATDATLEGSEEGAERVLNHTPASDPSPFFFGSQREIQRNVSQTMLKTTSRSDPAVSDCPVARNRSTTPPADHGEGLRLKRSS